MQFIRPDRCAELLSVSSRTVYRLVQDGELPAMKVRGALRILKPGLDEYIHKQLQLHSLETGFYSKFCDQRDRS